MERGIRDSSVFLFCPTSTSTSSRSFRENNSRSCREGERDDSKLRDGNLDDITHAPPSAPPFIYFGFCCCGFSNSFLSNRQKWRKNAAQAFISLSLSVDYRMMESKIVTVVSFQIIYRRLSTSSPRLTTRLHNKKMNQLDTAHIKSLEKTNIQYIFGWGRVWSTFGR